MRRQNHGDTLFYSVLVTCIITCTKPKPNPNPKHADNYYLMYNTVLKIKGYTLF